MKIRALKSFEGIKDIERGVYPKEGDIWEVDEERANFLKSHGVIEFVEEKKEETKEQWAVTKEKDGNVHVRPVVNDEIIDTPVEKVIKPKSSKNKKSSKK
jgi:hypothetical protein